MNIFNKTKISTQILGRKAEDIACRFLKKHGLQLLNSNYTCRSGEIDLIMRDNDYLVFIEVRARKNNNYGGAVASITPNKQKKIIKTSMHYLQQHRLIEKVRCRFDVIAITAADNVEWIKNAFYTPNYY